MCRTIRILSLLARKKNHWSYIKKNEYGLWRVSTAVNNLDKTKLNRDFDQDTEVQIIYLPYYGELPYGDEHYTGDITIAMPNT